MFTNNVTGNVKLSKRKIVFSSESEQISKLLQSFFNDSEIVLMTDLYPTDKMGKPTLPII